MFLMLNVGGRRDLGFSVVVRLWCLLHVGERRPRGARLLEMERMLAYAIREALSIIDKWAMPIGSSSGIG